MTGFCGDGFDRGGIGIGNGGLLQDGHFLQDGDGWLSKEDARRNLNGVRPALWIYVPTDFDTKRESPLRHNCAEKGLK